MAPFKHTSLSLFFHPFISHAKGLLRGPVFVENYLVLAFSKGQSSRRVRKQRKVTGFPAVKNLHTLSSPYLAAADRLTPNWEIARFSPPGDIKRVISCPIFGNHDWFEQDTPPPRSPSPLRQQRKTAVGNQEGPQTIWGLGCDMTGTSQLWGKTSTLGWESTGGGSLWLSVWLPVKPCMLGAYCVVKQSKGSCRGRFQRFREMCLYGWVS